MLKRFCGLTAKSDLKRRSGTDIDFCFWKIKSHKLCTACRMFWSSWNSVFTGSWISIPSFWIFIFFSVILTGVFISTKPVVSIFTACRYFTLSSFWTSMDLFHLPVQMLMFEFHFWTLQQDFVFLLLYIVSAFFYLSGIVLHRLFLLRW